MSKRDEAIQLFKSGYNCAQAVLLAFNGLTGLTEEQAMMLSSSFGAGMGKMREVCGTVSAMLMVAGLSRGYSNPADHEKKAAHYKLVQELSAEFKEKNGSIICRELLSGTVSDSILSSDTPPELRSDAYYKKRPCAELVGDAAEILEKNFLL